MLSLVFYSVLVFVIAVVVLSIRLFTPPRNFPKNIPTIPFYYGLLPLFKDVDQAVLYREYLKEPLDKYGAVKIFFSGQWNILVTRPSYVAEVFKHEDTYAKRGNHIKIPHSILAQYTGENIISAHGATWKTFQHVIKPALQSDHDSEQMWVNARLLKDMLLADTKQAGGAPVPVYAPLHRFALANLSEVLYTSSFGTMQRQDAPLDVFLGKIKPIIFNPIFMTFPFLDRLPLKARQEGRRLNQEFRKTLRGAVMKGHEEHTCNENDNRNLACRFIGSHREGILTDKQMDDNLVGTFVAGHENPHLLLMSILYLLGKYPEVQDAVRKEIESIYPADVPADFNPKYTELHDLPYLTSVIYESVRMYPPISQLVNRCTEGPMLLGDEIPIPGHVYIGYHAYATNRCSEFWGDDACEFKPERWGKTNDDINHMYRQANSKATFISFHGGKRLCLGQKFALQQMRITMTGLLREVKWTLDKDWPERMTPAGPLAPRALKVKFSQVRTANTPSTARLGNH